MKTHTNNFKNNLIKFGRELDSKITYTQNGTQVELGSEELNSITPHYEGGILKSVMRQLDIDSNVEIPLGTILTYQFGVKVGNQYEYINFGNYVVYKAEKQEDTDSWQITCYDKMLYAMKDYESLEITYPITVRNYINALCTKLGLTFKNASETFANYDKQIPKELYLDEDGNSLGYTYRDVLDELAQVTASTICINENDDQLEIRYITNTNDTIDEEYLKDVNVNFGESYGPINTIVLSRAGADNIYYPATLPQNPKEIKIVDNQIMNGNDRDTYMPDIYNKLNGLEYYINDFSSTGITYYNLCDRYNVQIGDNTYSCVMFNDEINVTQGLEENVYTEMPEDAETDYKKSDTTDRRINQTTLIVDKQQQEITALVDTTEDIQKEVNPTNTASGSSIYLEDSTNAELVNFEMEGKTTQETREGTNYFDASKIANTNIVVSDNGKTITMPIATSGNGLTGTGAKLKDLAPKLQVGDEVYLYFERNGETYNRYIYLYGSNFVWVIGNKRTITQEDLDGNVGLYGNRYTSGETEQITISDLRIVKNTSDEWEQYGTMPSPEFPSELVSVGYQNLFDSATFEANLVSGKIRNDSGTEVSDRTSTYSTYMMPIKANNTYTFKGYLQRVYLLNSSGTFVSRIIYNSSITLPMDATYTSSTDGYFQFQIRNDIYNSNKGEELVYVGTQEHSYIPYGKYGIEIKNTGKNLFNSEDWYNTLHNIKDINMMKEIVNGIEYYKFRPDGIWNYQYMLGQFKENTQYVLTCKARQYDDISVTSTGFTFVYTDGTTTAAQINLTFTEYDYKLTSLPNKTISYIRLGYAYNRYVLVRKIQLEENTQKTDYEEYKSKTCLYTLNQPLRSIGDTKDLLYIKNGMLYVERKIGSQVLNGSENWYGYSAYTGNGHCYWTENLDYLAGFNTSKCTHFKNVNASWETSIGFIGAYSDHSSLHRKYFISSESTIDDFKSWLSANNTEVQYILAEPNTEGLGKIEVPITYKTITHINTTDGNEPNMNITYVMNTQITNYVQNQVSQIKITEDGILAEVNRKVDNEEIIAKLNLAIEDEQGIIEITGNQVTIDSDYFKLNADGTIKSTGGTIGGYKITDNMLYAETFAKYNYTERDLSKIRNYLMGTGTLTPEEFEKYDVNESGTITSLDFIIIKFFIEYNVTPTSSAKIIMRTGNSISDNAYVLQDGAGNEILNIGFNGIRYKDFNITDTHIYSDTKEIIVGTWINGKSIYRKYLGNIGTITGTTTKTFDLSDMNIDKIIKIDGMIEYGSVYTGSLNRTIYYFDKSDNILTIYNANNLSIDDGFVYIEYTKTIG